MARIFAYIEHKGGVADDTAAELRAAAHAIDATASPIALVAGWGPDLDATSRALCATYGEVWKLGAEALAHPNAELVRQAIVAVLPRGSIVLVPHAHFGLDLAPGLSVKLDVPLASDVVAIEATEGATLGVVRQEFGGQVSAHVRCDISAGAVISVRPGAFKALDGASAAGTVVDKSADLGRLESRRRYLDTIVAEAGDVDVTKYATLVSIGRGIQEQDNVGIAQELADVMGAALSCSRPVVDAKWLEKSRQVGSSGKTVKPKVYLACGISGSFQHLAGIKGSPLIVAINKNARAPIFQVADVGIVDDILEFLPALTEKLRERQGATS
jgi:electron transfer flavoprotein alpha subunit